MLNEDFKDILSSLLEENVEFLLIGAYALAAYGYPRATKDIDIWVHASPTNAPRIINALRKFGAPSTHTTLQDFLQEGTVLQIGVPPRLIDITTKIDGVSFDEAYPRRMVVEIEGMQLPAIRAVLALKETPGTETRRSEKAGEHRSVVNAEDGLPHF